MSHGIDGGNSSNSFYNNITIDHNTIRSAQVLGIAVGRTDGLEITNNTVLKNGSGGTIGADRVNHDATDVTITGNTTHKLPEASGYNWAPTGNTSGGLDNLQQQDRLGRHLAAASAESLAPNAAVPDLVKSAVAASVASASAATTLAAASAADTVTADKLAADAQADTFRFDGHKGTGGQVDGLDFGAGDKLALSHFDIGTFHGVSGGNPLQVSARAPSPRSTVSSTCAISTRPRPRSRYTATATPWSSTSRRRVPTT